MEESETHNFCCMEHSGMANELENLKDSDKKQWETLEKVRDRLPNWAVLVISILVGMICVSATYAALAVRIANLSVN